MFWTRLNRPHRPDEHDAEDADANDPHADSDDGWVPGFNPLFDLMHFVDAVCKNQVKIASVLQETAAIQVKIARRAMLHGLVVIFLALAVLALTVRVTYQ